MGYNRRSLTKNGVICPSDKLKILAKLEVSQVCQVWNLIWNLVTGSSFTPFQWSLSHIFSFLNQLLNQGAISENFFILTIILLF